MRIFLKRASVLLVAASASAANVGGNDWRYFAAGGVSAALSHGYTTPIDVVKTRMQTNPELYNGSFPLAVQRIVKEEGVAFLFQGLGPTCVGYGIEGALKFGVYELCKPLFAHLTPSAFLNALLAACVAGAIAAVVLCPAEDVRIRLVADPGYASNALSALRRLTREKGALASFSGFPAMAAKQVPYTIGKQVSFDVACHCLRMAIVLVSADSTFREWAGRLVPAASALPAAVLACTLSHPGDMVLTEYFRGAGGSVAASLQRIVNRGGIRGLFLGLQARLIHVIGIIWVQLVLYDKLKTLLGLPATGSH